MSELTVGTLSGLAANSYVIDVASGSQLTQPGMVLQVVSATKTDTFSTSSTTFTDITGLTATITPSSTASKIYIVAHVNYGLDTSSSSKNGYLRLSGGNATDYVGDTAGSRVRAAAQLFDTTVINGGLPLSTTLSYVDSPASTSATTYSVQGRVNDATSNALIINRMRTDSDSALFGRTASSITLMEIAG